MKNLKLTTATTMTSCIAMSALRPWSALGAPVQGGRIAAGMSSHAGDAFGVYIVPATFKDVPMGVCAWYPPD